MKPKLDLNVPSYPTHDHVHVHRLMGLVLAGSLLISTQDLLLPLSLPAVEKRRFSFAFSFEFESGEGEGRDLEKTKA